MSSASRSKSKDKKAGKEPQKTPSKPSGQVNVGSGPISGYNPVLGKFHTLETMPLSSALPIQTNGRIRNIDEADDHSGNFLGSGLEYDAVSNNGSWSGESEDPKDKISHLALRPEAVPGADNDKREKIRQKNERKHQRQREKRAQELLERCRGFLMSRKLEALSHQLVAMGFSSERATMALILNEGKIEESVAWLLEGGEEADKDKDKEYNLDGSSLKIDISEELGQIADMEIRYKCSKQEVERAVVACEGDLEKAAESLKLPKLEQSCALPKPDETGDLPTISNPKLPAAVSYNSCGIQSRPHSSTSIQQSRDEKDLNYTKVAVPIGVSMELGNKNVQPFRNIHPKLDWEKPQLMQMPTEKKWSNAGSNPVASYSIASPLHAIPPPAKSERRSLLLGSELKNLQLGSVKESIVVMQRPDATNSKQAPTTSSAPDIAAGWYPNNVVVKSSTLSPYIPSTRSINPIGLGSNPLYSQFHYQQQQQFVSINGAVDPPGTTQGHGLRNRMGTTPSTLAAASSLGLFTSLGSNGSSESSSPIDWNTGGSMLQLDYTNVDWSLDRSSSSSSRSGGMWQGITSRFQKNSCVYDSYLSHGLGVRTATRLAWAGGASMPLMGLQDGGVVSSETSSAGGSPEWSSPFEEKDLFSLPRQFVSSPSL